MQIDTQCKGDNILIANVVGIVWSIFAKNNEQTPLPVYWSANNILYSAYKWWNNWCKNKAIFAKSRSKTGEEKLAFFAVDVVVARSVVVKHCEKCRSEEHLNNH